MEKVGLFIVGAPKCGTTALCSYLSEHPNICFSNPKESKYFHTDFDKKHRYAVGLSDYHACFSPNAHTRVLAEGTVWYLYSASAIENILSYNPAAKFIVMLRNPVDLVQSLHSQLYYGGDEDEADFYSAWCQQDNRKAGRNIPRNCRDAKSLYYGDVAKLGEQVQRLLAKVDRSDVLFLLFDDLKNDPKRCYQNALQHIGLEDCDRTSFPVINDNKVVQRTLLIKLIYRLKAIKDRLGIKKSFGIWGGIASARSKSVKRQSLPIDKRLAIWKYFESDVALLSTLVEVDLLTSWTPENLDKTN